MQVMNFTGVTNFTGWAVQANGNGIELILNIDITTYKYLFL